MRQLTEEESTRLEKLLEKMGIPDEEEALELAILEYLGEEDHDTLRRIFLVMFEDIEVAE